MNRTSSMPVGKLTDKTTIEKCLVWSIELENIQNLRRLNLFLIYILTMEIIHAVCVCWK